MVVISLPRIAAPDNTFTAIAFTGETPAPTNLAMGETHAPVAALPGNTLTPAMRLGPATAPPSTAMTGTGGIIQT
jgi:hypothetical protein